MTTPYHRAAVTLRHAASIVLCAHVHPDGDAVGSVLGLTLALREAGLPAIPTLADSRPAPVTYEFLPGYALWVPASELEAPDVFVALDAPALERLGEAQGLASAAGQVVAIDHHPDNREFGSVNIVDPTCASTSQIVWRLLQRLEIEPSVEVAMCLYVGLLTDTGRFQFQNTSADALRDAAAMVEAGADASECARLVYQNRSRAALEMDARAISRISLANGGRVAHTWIDEQDFVETGSLPEEAENLVEVVRALERIDVAVLLRGFDGGVRANLRSKSGFDVGAVARVFGGGGHWAAAGFTTNGSRAEILERLLPHLPGGENATLHAPGGTAS